MELTRKEEYNIIQNEGFSKTSFSSYQHSLSIYRRPHSNTDYSSSKNKKYRRGDVVYVSDTVFKGDMKNSIQEKSRPAVVIQNDVGNYHSKYLIVCYISTRDKNDYLPTHVYIDDVGRIRNSTVMAENIQSVHKNYCKFIGKVKPEVMEKIDTAIAESLGLKKYIDKLKQLEEENLRLKEAEEQIELEVADPTEEEHSKLSPESTGLLKICALEGAKHAFDISSGTISLSSLDRTNPVHLGNKDDVEQLIKELQEAIKYI